MGALTEYIFSHAVALNQSGRLKNNIYVHNRDVYILNTDHTVLIRFQLPAKEPTFKEPIGFAANDYDSEVFTEKDGKIIFTQKADGLVRKKICSATTIDGNFDSIAGIFKKFWSEHDKSHVVIQFSKDHLALLEESLSHLEFKGEDGQWLLTQRDIYTGNVIEVEDARPRGLISAEKIYDFGPIGIRTNDFMALFQFNDHVTFRFFPGVDGQYCLFEAPKFRMQGILAGCVYDEMGIIETAKGKTNGRQVKKNRASKQKADIPADTGTRRRRT